MVCDEPPQRIYIQDFHDNISCRRCGLSFLKWKYICLTLFIVQAYLELSRQRFALPTSRLVPTGVKIKQYPMDMAISRWCSLHRTLSDLFDPCCRKTLHPG